MKPKKGKSGLRNRQTAATREEILDVAMRMLSSGSLVGFSHESIAAVAGMGARTVYRHFPDRAELLQALWFKLRDNTDIKFPAREEEVISFIRSVFHAFDEHESVVRAVLSSPVGMEVRDRGGVEGRKAFAQSLSALLAGFGPTERTRAIAVFVAIYSAPFWQLLRDRGGLTGLEAQEAAAWLIEVLLGALRRTEKRKSYERTTRKKR